MFLRIYMYYVLRQNTLVKWICVVAHYWFSSQNIHRISEEEIEVKRSWKGLRTMLCFLMIDVWLRTRGGNSAKNIFNRYPRKHWKACDQLRSGAGEKQRVHLNIHNALRRIWVIWDNQSDKSAAFPFTIIINSPALIILVYRVTFIVLNCLWSVSNCIIYVFIFIF